MRWTARDVRRARRCGPTRGNSEKRREEAWLCVSGTKIRSMDVADQSLSGDSVEITWPLDETTMYSTLVRPSGAGPFPAVVMVAGSGPTDRDWNSPLLPGSHGSARLIAETLAQAGFASLRYDKRASGPHARET